MHRARGGGRGGPGRRQQLRLLGGFVVGRGPLLPRLLRRPEELHRHLRAGPPQRLHQLRAEAGRAGRPTGPRQPTALRQQWRLLPPDPAAAADDDDDNADVHCAGADAAAADLPEPERQEGRSRERLQLHPQPGM